MEILAVLGCVINMVGLLMFLYDMESLLELYRSWSIKGKACCLLGGIAAAEIVIHTGLYLVFFLAAEYAVILLFSRKKEKKSKYTALKGIYSILSILVTELIILAFLYYKGIDRLSDSEIRVICYLGMATIQFFWIVFFEIRKTRPGFRRMLMIALGVKAVENIAWLDICILGSVFEMGYLPMAIWFVFTIFTCYAVFFIVSHKVAERAEMEKRADIHVNTYEYYLHMEEEHLRIRKMYHDMKNQLMILENDQSKTAKISTDQVQALSQKLDTLHHQFYHTGFPSLDILLFDGKMKAEGKGIQFDAVISEGSLAFMKEEDVNVIFSNAIINAIEACEKITEGPRFIKIKAGKNLDDVLIYVKNTVSPDREKGSLHTSKKNKKLHGIGMTSIQEAAERYNGYVSIIEESDTFQLAILLIMSNDL